MVSVWIPQSFSPQLDTLAEAMSIKSNLLCSFVNLGSTIPAPATLSSRVQVLSLATGSQLRQSTQSAANRFSSGVSSFLPSYFASLDLATTTFRLADFLLSFVSPTFSRISVPTQPHLSSLARYSRPDIVLQDMVSVPHLAKLVPSLRRRWVRDWRTGVERMLGLITLCRSSPSSCLLPSEWFSDIQVARYVHNAAHSRNETQAPWRHDWYILWITLANRAGESSPYAAAPVGVDDTQNEKGSDTDKAEQAV